MSYAGHVLDMIRRINQNRNLRKNSIDQWKAKSYSPKTKLKYNDNFTQQFTKKERSQINASIHRNQYSRNLKLNLVTVIGISIFLLVIYYFWKMMT